MARSEGVFTISLDFELYWGMRDVVSYEAYRAHIEGTPGAIEAMLERFVRNKIHATWAVVGFLFFPDKTTLLDALPDPRPAYTNKEIDLYDYLRHEALDPKGHFAPDLIRKIARTPHQEVASHTFSHYYCLEEGQNEASFAADLDAAQKCAAPFGLSLKSLVFPRNQANDDYLPLLPRYGFRAYRGNEEGWLYEATDEASKKSLLRRLGRICDSYLNLSGHHTYSIEALAHKAPPYDIPASRFLRPYSRALAPLDPLKLRRIKAGMREAARKGHLYHLWWHPHNFGLHTERHLAYLEEILEEYTRLEERYGMRSCTMSEVAELIDAYRDASAAR